MNTLAPEVSAWYQDLLSGSLFEVVAIDDASDTIEIQMVDGEVGEYDSASWEQLHLSPAEAPEDWRTPYELSLEDQIDTDRAFVPENFSGVLADIEPDLMDFDLGEDFRVL